MKRWRLGMRDRAEFRPRRDVPEGFEVARVSSPSTELNRVLHSVVGRPWRWGGRHGWGEAEWRTYVHREALETWIGYVDRMPAGYYELEHQEDGSVRIQCFGLMEPYIGKGFGGAFISHAVARCWDTGATRIWLNTCSRDHPNALRNYTAHGFRIESKRESPD